MGLTSLESARPRWLGTGAGRLGRPAAGVFAGSHHRVSRARSGAGHPGRPLSLTLGAALCLLFLAAAALAPHLAPFPPDQVLAGPRLAPPDSTHLFGTDALGRDMLSRVLHGAGLALELCLLGLAVAVPAGVLAGLLAGYHGGRLDQILSRSIDVWLAFPGLLLALLVVARLGPSLRNSALALGIVGLPTFFRVTRGLAMSLRRMPYVEAARAAGAGDLRLIGRHILPNIAGQLAVLASMRAGTLILAGGSLGFVGLGAQPPAPEWGVLLASAWTHLDSAPWLAIYPGLATVATVIGLSLLGDGLRDVLDPVRRSR